MEKKEKLPRGGRVNTFRSLARFLERRLLELDKVPDRFKQLGQDEPIDVLLSRVRVCGYIGMALSSIFEKRDITEKWEKQVVQLESIIAELNGQLQEARAQQRYQ